MNTSTESLPFKMLDDLSHEFPTGPHQASCLPWSPSEARSLTRAGTQILWNFTYAFLIVDHYYRYYGMLEVQSWGPIYCLLIGVAEVVPAHLGAAVFLIMYLISVRELECQGCQGCGL